MPGKAGKTRGMLAAPGYALHPLKYGHWDGATLAALSRNSAFQATFVS